MNRRKFMKIAAATGGAAALGPLAHDRAASHVALHLQDAPLTLDRASFGRIPGVTRLAVPGEGAADSARAGGSGQGAVMMCDSLREFLEESRQANHTITSGQAGGDGSLLPTLIENSRHLVVIGPLAASAGRIEELLDLARRRGTRISVALPEGRWMAAARSGSRGNVLVDHGPFIASSSARLWNAACLRSLHAGIHVMLAATPPDTFLGASVFRTPSAARGCAPVIHHVIALEFRDSIRHIRLSGFMCPEGEVAKAVSDDQGIRLAWDAATPLSLENILARTVSLAHPFSDCSRAIEAERVFATCLAGMAGREREARVAANLRGIFPGREAPHSRIMSAARLT